MTAMPSGTAPPNWSGLPSSRSLAVAGRDDVLGLPDDRRLRAGAADPSAQLAVRGDDRSRALLA